MFFIFYGIGYAITTLVIWTIGYVFMLIGWLYQCVMWLLFPAPRYDGYPSRQPASEDDDNHGGWGPNRERPRRPKPDPPRHGVEYTPPRERLRGMPNFADLKEEPIKVRRVR